MDRMLDQYRDSPRVIDLLSVLTDNTELAGVYNALRGRLDIDTMEGVQLDRIGDIIGRPRPFLSSDDDESFAFDGAGGLGFNLGLFRSSQYVAGQGDPAPDSQYRVFLRAAIFRNYANGSMADIVRFINLALGLSPIILNRVGFIILLFTEKLSTFQVRLIQENIPLASGIGLQIQDEVPPETLYLDYLAQTYYVGDLI